MIWAMSSTNSLDPTRPIRVESSRLETTLEEASWPSTTGSSIYWRSSPGTTCWRLAADGVLRSPFGRGDGRPPTATTISERQYQYALKRIRKNGWEDRISIVKQDYRNLTGQFDRIVSIEMIEAVGHEYLPSYFSKISDLLAPDGAALIQGITMPDHRYGQYLKEVDYIRTRVFPGSCVPSASAMIAAAVKRSDLRPAALHDFGYHYSRTLREWRIRFKENEEKIEALGYDDSFRRAWEYYLCY